MKICRFLSFVSILILLFSCTSSKKTTVSEVRTVKSLRFINEYVIPNNYQFKGTLVGGLSSIDYDPATNLYYLICDDRSERNPARFYTAKIRISDKGIDSVEFTNAVTLLDKQGNSFPSHKTEPALAPDPESMRYDPRKNLLIWGSEGERLLTKNPAALEDPAVLIMSTDGKYKDSFAIPDNLRMHATEKGPRRNGVFEGLAFTDNYKYLFASVEEPLYEDGSRAGSGDSTAWVRFIKFNTKTRKPVAQYAYQIDALPFAADPPGAFKVNGISDIMSLSNNQFIVIERAFVSGKNSNFIRLYLADARYADDISKLASLDPAPTVKPITKTLLLNMDDLGRYIDNVEGITSGPLLANGHQSLILVADNNFDEKEKTQFFLFEIIP